MAGKKKKKRNRHINTKHLNRSALGSVFKNEKPRALCVVMDAQQKPGAAKMAETELERHIPAGIRHSSKIRLQVELALGGWVGEGASERGSERGIEGARERVGG